jgi:transposase
MLAEASCAEGCCGALTSPSSAKATRSPGGTGGPRATPRAASSISSSGQLGVGPEVASALLVAARDNPGRLRTEASFAALCGTSPVEASSGKITRHRLNQGGNREANNALWRIVMVRLTCDQRTRNYLTRRRAEGKTDREIIRCLKRYIAREIYTLPCTDGPVLAS